MIETKRLCEDRTKVLNIYTVPLFYQFQQGGEISDLWHIICIVSSIYVRRFLIVMCTKIPQIEIYNTGEKYFSCVV